MRERAAGHDQWDVVDGLERSWKSVTSHAEMEDTDCTAQCTLVLDCNLVQLRCQIESDISFVKMDEIH